jgi:hypothetical protein
VRTEQVLLLAQAAMQPAVTSPRPSYIEVLAVVPDWITALGVACGLWIAWKGLETWRAQLQGTTEYELARRLLRATYRVREEIGRVRHFYMDPVSEASSAAKVLGREITGEGGMNQAQMLAYEGRWKRLMDARTDFEVEELEAEVLWPTAKADCRPLHLCMGKLYAAMRSYMRELQRPNDRRGAAERKYHEVVFDASEEDNPDAYAKSLAEAVERIEQLCRPHLRR